MSLEPKTIGSKTIRVSGELYEYLCKHGTLKDSFNDVLRKFIKIEKE